MTVVGIGASAGGLAALQAFFGSVLADSGLAYVVVMHLDPGRESQIAELLQHRTSIAVTQATESVELEPDHAYIIPPNRSLRVEGGKLRLGTRGEHGRHAPIDLFFRTLAEAYGTDGVGVVLSGTGTDGSSGLRLIKEAGGITVAQAPEEAEYEAMPQSAIATGHVDLVLRAAEIPGHIARLDRGRVQLVMGGEPPAHGASAAEQGDDAQETALRQILGRLRSQTGHDFSHYKRATVLRRLERRLRFHGVETLAEYRDVLRESSREVGLLLKDLLISVSGFFRDPEAFDAIERQVVPGLFEGKQPHDRIRVWVPGCATGEEVYSLAILLAEHGAALDEPPQTQIFATDIDEEACAAARAAAYPPTIAEDVTPQRLRRFFIEEAGRYRVEKNVRERVVVASHDLLRDPPFSHLDLISCRNVLIYLQPEAQRRALEIFHYALRPGGVLVLGTAETADAGADLFVPASRKLRIYTRTAGTPVARLPLLRSTEASAPGVQRGEGSAHRTFSYGALHLRMLEEYAPPSLVVNEAHEIVHLSERAGRYLRIGGGEPTHDLIALAPDELRVELRTALHQAFQRGRSTRRSIRLDTPDGVRRLELVVRPPEREEKTGRFALVVFEERADAEEERPAPPSEGGSEAVVEEELRRMRAQLRETIEERESTIEALQAANEELQSINEEQKVTSEELETSREELQSINEELITLDQEHRSTIDELSHANADLRNLMDATEIGTIFLDRELRVRRFTPAIAPVLNLRDADRGRPLSDLAHKLRYDGLLEDAKRVLTTLQREQREVESVDGNWYTLRIVPYRSVDSRIDGVVVTFFDITPQKRVEAEVRQASRLVDIERARLGALMEQMQAAVLVAEAPTGRILGVNRRFREIWGAGFSSAGSFDAYGLARAAYHADGSPYRAEEWPISRAIRDAEAVLDEEIDFALPDGRRITLLVSAAPVKVSEGRVDAAVVTMTDITTRAELEHELRVARAAAEEANQAKAVFLSTVSHELRTPLTAILGYADLLLLKGSFGEDQKQRVERIKLAALHLSGLIDQLVGFARLEEGRESAELATVDAREVAHEAAALAEPLAAAKGLALNVELPAGPVELATDRAKARQILVNLLGNAVKYTERGEVSLVLAPEEDRVVFRVRDTGVGISPEHAEKVFERFWQAGGEPPGVAGGTGIGLAVVRGLSRLLGGDVELESVPGRGSTFTVWLPRRGGAGA